MQFNTKESFHFFLGLFIFIAFGYFLYEIIGLCLRFIKSINPNLAVGLITAFATVVASTLTITLGKYYERKKEVEAHFRDKKVNIYDKFLIEFYGITVNSSQEEDSTPDQHMVTFLNEWQRQIILWGGPSVLSRYIEWKEDIARLNPTAKTMFLTEDFFKALRKDIGLSNRGIKKGDLIHLFMRNANLLISLAKDNPEVTLAEMSRIEKEVEAAQSE